MRCRGLYDSNNFNRSGPHQKDRNCIVWFGRAARRNLRFFLAKVILQEAENEVLESMQIKISN